MGSSQEVELFFSRRIGISPGGRPVPIKGGVRLTGQVAGLVVGALWMRTSDLAAEGIVGATSPYHPASDYAVVRIRKNVCRVSDLGGIAMMRQNVTTSARSSTWSLVLGGLPWCAASRDPDSNPRIRGSVRFTGRDMACFLNGGWFPGSQIACRLQLP